MFSYPWSKNENSPKTEGGKDIECSFTKIGKLNKILSKRPEFFQNSLRSLYKKKKEENFN